MQHNNNLPATGATTLGALVVTWLPAIDIWLRVGASLVAILSGLLVAYTTWKNHKRSRP